MMKIPILVVLTAIALNENFTDCVIETSLKVSDNDFQVTVNMHNAFNIMYTRYQKSLGPSGQDAETEEEELSQVLKAIEFELARESKDGEKAIMLIVILFEKAFAHTYAFVLATVFGRFYELVVMMKGTQTAENYSRFIDYMCKFAREVPEKKILEELKKELATHYPTYTGANMLTGELSKLLEKISFPENMTGLIVLDTIDYAITLSKVMKLFADMLYDNTKLIQFSEKLQLDHLVRTSRSFFDTRQDSSVARIYVVLDAVDEQMSEAFNLGNYSRFREGKGFLEMTVTDDGKNLKIRPAKGHGSGTLGGGLEASSSATSS